jgi:hypothetical protein
MSHKVLNWALDLPLKGLKKPVLVMLANSAGPNGLSRISMARLKLHTGFAERAIQMALKELQADKVISERYSEGGRHQWSHFQLDLNYRVEKPSLGDHPAGKNGVKYPAGDAGFHASETRRTPSETPHEMRGNGTHENVNTPHIMQKTPHEMRGHDSLRLHKREERLPLPSQRTDQHLSIGESASRARAGTRARAQPLPRGWQPNAEEERYAADLGLPVPSTAAKFVAWHRKEGTRSPDWTAAWEFWCLDQVERNGKVNGHVNGHASRHSMSLEERVLAEIAAREAAE